MDRLRYWGPRIAGKYWGPVSASLALGELMYEDASKRTNDWLLSTGLKRDRSGNMIRRDPPQAPLRLPAKPEGSNNLNMDIEMRGASRGRSRSRARSRSVRSRARSRKRRVGMEGRYTGPFKFPSKKPVMAKTPVALKGSRGQHEGTIDAVTAGDVAYIGFSSFIRRIDFDVTNALAINVGVSSPIYHIAVCIIRQLFKRQWNVDFEHHNQTLGQLYLDGFAASGRIDVFYKKELASNGTTGQTVAAEIGADPITITSASSLRSIAQDLATLLVGTNYGARGWINVSGVPWRYQLYGIAFAQDYAGATAYKYTGIMRLDGRYVKVNSKSVIYVQNQTTSDAGSTSTDVIDTNPIHGKIFYFKDPAPEVRYFQGPSGGTQYSGPELRLMHDANADGVIYPLGNIPSSTTGSPWNQMPTSDMFCNLSKYSNFSMAPGELKKLTLRFSFDGLLQKFIEGLCLGAANMTEGDDQSNPSKYQHMRMTDALGTSVLFAFEKRLSTGSNNVEVGVQRNVYCSAMLKGKKKLTLMPIAVTERTIPKDDTVTGANP